jgi:hypothetical protein
MLQWNLKAGTLQTLLDRFESQTRRLHEFFGDDTSRVQRLMGLRHTSDQRTQAVREATDEKLATRWRAPLLRLCADPQFCALLMGDVSSRMAHAQNVARQLGLRTVRGLTMCFDINAGDGLGTAKVAAFSSRIARLESQLGHPLTERERLVEIANEAADRLTNWREERRARRLVIANGTGVYRRQNWDLDRLFPTLNDPWE